MTLLSDAVKAKIQTGYRDFLKARDLKPRAGQRQMIGTIASTLGKTHLDEDGNRIGAAPICVVEGGTGTGKTLAYLLAILPMAEALGKTVVVATGTVALQSQLLEKDIPELIAATGWEYRFAVAKGRGRYLCNIKLDQCLDTVGAEQAGLYLFEDEQEFKPDRHARELIKTLAESLELGVWNGDRDSWPDTIEDSHWRALTVDRRQCAGHRCRKISDCCFFQARAELDDVHCIVANHDLVMADLALGGGVILPPPEDTIYVFDEAHRLAETTLRHFGSASRLQGTVQWLDQIHKGISAAAKNVAQDGELITQLERVVRALDSIRQQLREAVPLIRSQFDALLPSGADHYRFPGGDIGDDNRTLSLELANGFSLLNSYLDALSSMLEKAVDNPHHAVPRVDLEHLFQGVGNWLGRIESVTALWHHMAQQDTEGEPPRARWLALDDSGQDIVVSVSPISAADILRDSLWDRCCSAVATSATVRALGSFERFANSAGLPDSAVTLAVPGAFDFSQAGVLAIPDIGADGGQPTEHTQAVIDHLASLIDIDSATLVLFSSRRQMQTVAESVSTELRSYILMQGDYSHSEIVRRHRSAIDEGDGSIIFGLASFAEGLDLPGDYCRHVVIAKLPFAVPDNPMQSAQAEWLESRGLNPFKMMTLPDTSLRLIQACGRLLRTEQDGGRVTILDRRLVTKFYGRQLLDSLPPFRREIS